MKGVLVLGHGSRAKETEATLESVVAMVREMLSEKYPDAILEIGYMEFGKINIEAGLDKLRERGADEIVITPYFLFEGIHIREDIPNEIGEYIKKHPDVKITLGKTLGVDRRLAEVLKDRIEGCLA